MHQHRLQLLGPALSRVVSAWWTAPSVVALAACFAYLPTVVISYAFSDDYRYFGFAHGTGGSVWRLTAGGGRPFQGLELAAFFSAIPDLDSVRLVRLFGLVGTVLLGILLYYVLRARDVDRWVALGISVSIITLPSFQVYVSWAVLSAAPYAAILSGLASLRISSAYGWSPDGRRRYLEAVALMLCALLTYQPAAMLFWVFTAVEVLRPGERLHRATRMLATRLGVAIAAMACGLFANRVGVHFYPSVYSGRSRLVDDVVEKISWFGREPLVNSLNLFDLVPAHSVAVAVAIVAAVGILLLHAGEGRGSFGFLALAAALVPLSYLPNLAIAENWASYRSVGALSALLTLYAWLGLWGISRALPTLGARSVRSVLAARAAAVALALLLSFVFLALIVVPLSHLHGPSAASGAVASAFGTWPRITLFVLFFVVLSAIAFAPSESTAKAVAAAAGRLAVAAFAITGVLLAARNVTTLFARPQNVELRMMQSMLATAPASPIRHVVFVKPFFREGAAPLVRYDEFGNPSSYFPWVPIPAVLLTLQEQRQQTMRPDIDVLAWDARTIPRSTGPGEVLVDMRKVRQRRVGWSLWALQTESTSAGYVAPDRAETRRR